MRILIVDDDRLMHEAYELELANDGYDLSQAHDLKAARALLAGPESFDVVLLDQNLEGAEGGPVGLQLIPEIQALAPGVAIVVVSGYWERAGVIQRALDAGATDYLVKGQHLMPLLRAKLAVISRERGARQLAFLSDAQFVAQMEANWRALQVETDSQKKGRLLEQVVYGLFRLAGVFRRVETNHHNGLEEIDLYAFAEAPSWQSESSLWLVECKNWGPDRKVGRHEMDALVGKMGRRHGTCSRGLMVALNGVSEPFIRGAHLQTDWVLAIADRADLQEAVGATDRAAVIRSWFDRAVMSP